MLEAPLRGEVGLWQSDEAWGAPGALVAQAAPTEMGLGCCTPSCLLEEG